MKESLSITQTLYLDGYQYVNGNLEFFPVAGAYVKKTESTGATKKRWYDYVFNYTDHLGNIRLSYTFDYNTNKLKTLEENHYYPFGLKHRKYNNLLSDIQFKPSISNRGLTPIVKGKTYKYKYNGKELQDELGLNVYDYGARMYMPDIGRWGQHDPLSEETLDPYGYVWNNPMIMIDPDGRSGQTTIVEKGKKDGTYVVKDWIDDGKTDVVLQDGTKVGESLTTHSFVDDAGNAVVGAVIDTNSSEGQKFIDNEIIAENPFIVNYMINGTGGQDYDFKERGMNEAKKEGKTEIQHRYRGSMTSDGKMASARDFGNVTAGIVAGRFGLSWGDSRFGFDGLETLQKFDVFKISPLTISGFSLRKHVEGIPTQKAQKVGYGIGRKLNTKENPPKMKTNNPFRAYP